MKKIFMFDETEAVKNNCYFGTNPVKGFLIYLGVFLGFFILMFPLFIWISFIPLVFYVTTWVLITVVGFYSYLKKLKSDYWGQQTAFIKENNTFWVVKLTYMSKQGVVVTKNLATILFSAKQGFEAAADTRQREKEMQERKVIEQSYIDALNEAGTGKNVWVKDLDKNFLICNGRQSVIRLDELKILKETEKYFVVQYKDYRNKLNSLKIIKAYPELLECMSNTKVDEYDDVFPHNIKVGYNMYTTGIVIISIVLIFLLYLIIISI